MSLYSARKAKDLINSIIEEDNLQVGLNISRAKEVWNKVCGDSVAKYTESVNLSRGVMYVLLSSPALKNELHMGRTKLVELINEQYGSKVVKTIIFK